MVKDTIFSGESKNIEYKVTLPDKSEKYMKTIVAFANTQGGKLIVVIRIFSYFNVSIFINHNIDHVLYYKLFSWLLLAFISLSL